MARLILASASPARRFLLESAGLHPEVQPSGAREDGISSLGPTEAVGVLAERKARQVADRLVERSGGKGCPGSVFVLACDSLLEFGGRAWGKPSSPDEVVSRWQAMRGSAGHLHTGHCLLDPFAGTCAEETDTARVHFGWPTDSEIEAYSRTAESLQVAGPFTLEGRSAAWVERIEGNYGTVTGVSLVVVRRLLERLGVKLTDMWA